MATFFFHTDKWLLSLSLSLPGLEVGDVRPSPRTRTRTCRSRQVLDSQQGFFPR